MSVTISAMRSCEALGKSAHCESVPRPRLAPLSFV